MRRFLFALALFLVFSNTLRAEREYSVLTITQGLEFPWAMAFLPNEDILITERTGSIRVVREGQLLDAPVTGVPQVYYAGQGGLLDIMLDQDFANNKTLYLSFAYGDRKANGTRLISAILQGNTLTEQKVLFTAEPLKNTAHHYAGRIAQLKDGSLLLSVGDGFDFREQAQELDSHLGKIIRIDRNGRAPSDNPFVSDSKAKPEIWTLGHRNQQALLVANGIVYENEHGPQGGDEVNIIEPGLNYGWPIITQGIDYNGARITPFTEYKGMQQAQVDWTPSIAPSSMTMHEGSLYVTSLAEKSIRRLRIDGDKIVDEGVVFPELTLRLRDIVSAPDGHLYVLSDGDNAELLKITVLQDEPN